MSNIQTWDYRASVEKVRPMVTTWRTLTVEIVEELYRAREELRSQGARTDLTSGQVTRSWEGYLDDIGLAKRTVNRWLERYEPTENRLMEPEEVEERKRIADRAAQDAAVAQRKRINEAISTGRKPADWDDATERAYQRELKERADRRERIDKARASVEEAEREREQERKRREEERASWSRTDEILREALEHSSAASNKRREFKERIRISQSGESDVFIDALMDYLEELEDDNRRIEACQNIIKVCRNVAAELQRS